MTAPATPTLPQLQFATRVRFTVADEDGIYPVIAPCLAEGGLFVRHDRPPAVGALVLIECVLPDGVVLSRITARVVHARPATSPGEKTAGMQLVFMQSDAVAQAALARGTESAVVPATPTPAATKLASLSANFPQQKPAPNAPIIGIDLGTVNSCVAVVLNGEPVVMRSPEGYETLPSVVFLATDGTVAVGHKAVEKMILQPHRAIYGSKRFLGRPYASKEVRALGHFFNYELVAGPDGRTAARLGNTALSLEDVAAQILFSLKEMASQHLKMQVGRAVITVPAYFGETQRQAVRDAGKLAGLQVELIVNEPTAAAIAYGHGRGLKRTILVYDLGGGTFDVSLLRVDGNRFEVLASDGDPFLGGNDFDDRLTEYVLTTFERANKINLRDDAVAVQRVRFAAQKAKHELSDTESAAVEVPYVVKGPNGMLDLKVSLDRRLLEAFTQDLVDRTLAIVDSVLSTAGLSSAQLDDVLYVGGQSRSPHVRQLMGERFNRRPASGVHPDQAVAVGAALVGAALQDARGSVQLIDVLPASIRVALADGQAAVVLQRGAKLPASKSFAVDGSAPDVRVALYRGESRIANENSFLGVLRLPGKTMGAAGTRAHVTLNVNAEGLLAATITNPATAVTHDLEVSLIE